MKNHLTIAVLIALTLVSLCFGQTSTKQAAKSKSKAAQDSALVEKLAGEEKAIWGSVKNKQADEFGSFLADDYTAVYNDGIRNKSEDVESVRNVDLKDFSFTDVKVVFPQKNMAVVTYKATVHGSFKGQDFSGVYFCSSVWVIRGGKWLGVLHTEAKS